MFRVILKDKFRERPINLSRLVRIMYTQELSGSIRQEHIEWWKRYWIKPIYLEILYPKKGWITLVKVFREGKPSIRVIVPINSSFSRGLLVLNKLYGEEEYNEQKKRSYKELDTRRMQK